MGNKMIVIDCYRRLPVIVGGTRFPNFHHFLFLVSVAFMESFHGHS